MANRVVFPIPRLSKTITELFVDNSFNDYKPGAEKTPNPFGMNMMAFKSPEDLMKNLPKATRNISKAMTGRGFPTDSPTFKISMREYEDMAIRVGDKITIEINKSDSSSGR
jgi:hypothetical protein